MNSDTRTPLTAEQLEDAARLKALFEKIKPKGGQLKFGLENDIGGQSAVSHYLNGIRPLNLNAAVKFARGLGVSVHDFSPRLAAQLPPSLDTPAVVEKVVQVAQEGSGQTVIDFIRWQFEREGELAAQQTMASYMKMLDSIVADMHKRKAQDDNGR